MEWFAIAAIILIVALSVLSWVLRRPVMQIAAATSEVPSAMDVPATVGGLNDFDDDDFDSEEAKSPARKKILFVALNEFKNCSALGGCVDDQTDVLALARKRAGALNDMRDMRETLKALGAAGWSVKTLTNQNATAEKIKAGMRWLFQGTQPGDIRLYGHSGHGTQTPDPTEKDGCSETIVPYDFDWDNPKTWIVDDDIYALYKDLPNGGNISCWLDCCHPYDDERDVKEGVLSRSIASHMPRPKTAPVKRIAPQSNSNYHDAVVFLCAAREDQTSADATFIDPKTGNPRKNGAFTYFMIKSLEEMPTAPLADVMERCSTLLAENGFDQIPQLRGSERLKKLPFLSV